MTTLHVFILEAVQTFEKIFSVSQCSIYLYALKRDLASGRLVHSLGQHSALTPASTIIASGMSAGTLELWEGGAWLRRAWAIKPASERSRRPKERTEHTARPGRLSA